MAAEQEFHAYRGRPAERNGKYTTPDDDQVSHISQYDDDTAWTLDVYSDRHTKTLAGMGCTELPCTYADGNLYRLTAQQLIEFIAADAGLNVEFRQRKKRTMTDEQRQALAARMRRINAERIGQLSDG